MSNQKEETRDYINGKLDGLNILMIYAKDGKSIRVEEVQQEIDHVMNTPVKKDAPVSTVETDRLNLQAKEAALIRVNKEMEKALELSNNLADSLANLPIFQDTMEYKSEYPVGASGHQILTEES